MDEKIADAFERAKKGVTEDARMRNISKIIVHLCKTRAEHFAEAQTNRIAAEEAYELLRKAHKLAVEPYDADAAKSKVDAASKPPVASSSAQAKDLLEAILKLKTEVSHLQEDNISAKLTLSKVLEERKTLMEQFSKAQEDAEKTEYDLRRKISSLMEFEDPAVSEARQAKELAQKHRIEELEQELKVSRSEVASFQNSYNESVTLNLKTEGKLNLVKIELEDKDVALTKQERLYHHYKYETQALLLVKEELKNEIKVKDLAIRNLTEKKALNEKNIEKVLGKNYKLKNKLEQMTSLCLAEISQLQRITKVANILKICLSYFAKKLSEARKEMELRAAAQPKEDTDDSGDDSETNVRSSRDLVSGHKIEKELRILRHDFDLCTDTLHQHEIAIERVTVDTIELQKKQEAASDKDNASLRTLQKQVETLSGLVQKLQHDNVVQKNEQRLGSLLNSSTLQAPNLTETVEMRKYIAEFKRREEELENLRISSQLLYADAKERNQRMHVLETRSTFPQLKSEIEMSLRRSEQVEAKFDKICVDLKESIAFERAVRQAAFESSDPRIKNLFGKGSFEKKEKESYAQLVQSIFGQKNQPSFDSIGVRINDDNNKLASQDPKSRVQPSQAQKEAITQELDSLWKREITDCCIPGIRSWVNLEYLSPKEPKAFDPRMTSEQWSWQKNQNWRFYYRNQFNKTF